MVTKNITNNQIQGLVLDFVKYISTSDKINRVYFSDYMAEWLERRKTKVQTTTYQEYVRINNKYIIPYFSKKLIYLDEITAKDIDKYYAYLSSRGLSNNTILKHHANIHHALKLALIDGLVTTNVASLVELPKKVKFLSSFYTLEEMKQLLQLISNTKFQTPVILACILGLRRSEVIGLKWDCVDFKTNTIQIKRKAYYNRSTKEDIVSPVLKNNTSYRTLVMPTILSNYLKRIYIEQEQNKKKKNYCKDFIGFVNVDENGVRIRLNYLSSDFPKLIKKSSLKVIRFHDLRHSCASMLLALGFSMKELQEYLGHSDYSTTANIYAHLLVDSKQQIANKLDKAFNLSK